MRPTAHYSRQIITQADRDAVDKALASDYLTTGPEVAPFESDFAQAVGVGHAVAVSSGTAALHVALATIGMGPGQSVIVPAMTFAATANAVLYTGASPIIVDIDPDTLLIDVDQAQDAARRSDVTAIMPVDYAGQPVDYDLLSDMGAGTVIGDCCHSLGGSYKGKPVAAWPDIAAFSLHAVKAITSGEGGVMATDNPFLAKFGRQIRSHGRGPDGAQHHLGYNYRLTDFQCALARSQLRSLKGHILWRRILADAYDEVLAGLEWCRPLGRLPDREHAWHLYVVRIDWAGIKRDRQDVRDALAAVGVGTQVHYRPLSLQPYYVNNDLVVPGQCPVADAAYRQILSLPCWPGMSGRDVEYVVEKLREVCGG